MPDVADVKAACEAEATRLERYKLLGARKPMPRIEGPKLPGRRANVFVPPDAPQYAAMLERAKTADSADWRYDEIRPGIWVRYDWIAEPKAAARVGFTTFTEEQLRAMYPQPKPASEVA